MIKLETIVNSLSNFKERPYKLPDGNKFTQRTSFQMKTEELEQILNISNSEINKYINTTMNTTMNTTSNTTGNITDVKEQSFKKELNNTNNDIIFNDNEILDIPEVISCLFNNIKNKSKLSLDKNDYYIYGIKNIESFYTSLVLLTQSDYIIKTKSEKNGVVISFKRELGLKLETTFDKFDYKELNFKKNKMITDLMNDHNLDFSLQITAIDYIKHDVCIINVDTKSYMYLRSYNIDNLTKLSFYIILNINDNFLPVMNSKGIHLFNDDTFNLIKCNFEKGKCEKKYKERIVVKINTPLTSSDNSEIETSNEENPEINLKALSSYKLKELQDLAIKHNINIKKNSGNGKMKNKTKEELYNTLSA